MNPPPGATITAGLSGVPDAYTVIVGFVTSVTLPVGLWPPNDWKSFSVSGDFDRIVVGVPFGHSSTVTGSTGTGSAANPSP